MSTTRKMSTSQLLLQELIGRNAVGVTCKCGNYTGTMFVGTLAPGLAKRILEACNLRNRKIRQNKVEEYTGYQTDGEWQPQGYLMFSDFGELLEGQHRVAATLQSGLTIQFFVLVRPTAQSQRANRYQDIGVYRTIGDFLRFNGVENPYRVAPMLVIERNDRVTGDPLQNAEGTKDQYLVIYHEIGADPFKKAFEVHQPKLARQLGVRPALLDWFALRAARVDADAAHFFYSLLQDPSQLRSSDPAWVLREHLIEGKAKREGGNRGGLSATQQLTSVAKTWRFFSENKSVKLTDIKHRANEQWPGIFGE